MCGVVVSLLLAGVRIARAVQQRWEAADCAAGRHSYVLLTPVCGAVRPRSWQVLALAMHEAAFAAVRISKIERLCCARRQFCEQV